MKIYGRGILDVKTEEDAKWFLDMYKQSHWQNIVDYRTFRVTTLRLENFKYVAFIEPGGGIRRLVELEDKLDFLEFYAQEGLDGYSNTSGMAYVRCYQRNDAKHDYDELAMLCLDNSPYDLSPTDDDWEYTVGGEDGEEIRAALNRFLGEGHDSTFENTLYITQL